MMIKLLFKEVLLSVKVIVDTDFLNHILKAKNGINTIKTIIDFFDFELVMHTWVYDREVKGINSDVQKFVDNNVEIVQYQDFLTDEEDWLLYDFEFKALFVEMNHREVSLGKQTFDTYNKSGENLGEIHSVILSRFTGIPLLLSDDYNAKEIAAKRLNSQGFSLNVKKSFELLCEIISEDENKICLDDAVSVIRNYKNEYQKDFIREIKSIYKEKHSEN